MNVIQDIVEIYNNEHINIYKSSWEEESPPHSRSEPADLSTFWLG